MKIGILGGGQLGRMLALAGYPLGFEFKIFDGTPDAPAGQVAPQLCEDINDTPALLWFSRHLDAITYEWENVPVASARFLEQRVPLFPPPRALEIAQDRLKEKSFFLELGVPTPPFEAVETREELNFAVKQLGLPAVLKTRRFGYDGKGQHVLRTPRDVEKAWEKLGGVPLILEGFVPFDREVSLLAVRGRDGQKLFYPLVENHHRDGILRLSLAPAPHWTAALQSDAELFASRIIDRLEYVGVMALELFQVGDRLIANEIAPRVHNSGHWTIEGAATSQFENHLRAVAGLPLGPTTVSQACAMVNLIGALPPLCEVLKIAGAAAHYYGKEARPGRKLGHITLTGSSLEELREPLARAQALPGAEMSEAQGPQV